MKSINKLLPRLPPPNDRYVAPGVVFEIYRAKDLSRNRWNAQVLRDMLLLCRTSYARYGDRPLLDVYDAKAAIYLVRARYDLIEEWLSVRIVPGDGKPIGVHEPEIFTWEGKAVDGLMKRKIGVRNFWNRVAGSQRMCGIHPYGVGGAFLKDPSHRYTAVAFAVMHLQFLRDYPLKRFPYRYFTALIRPDYYKKGLAQRNAHGKMIYPVFTSARSFLGFRRGTVRVARDIFSYQFPLYWFDAKQLLQLVNDLRRSVGKAPLPMLKPQMFYNISKGTDRPALIAGLRIAPSQMRRLMDQLPDAPELKITPAAAWYRGMQLVLDAAGVVREGVV